MSTIHFAVAGAQAVLLTAVGWIIGDLVTTFFRRNGVTGTPEPTEVRPLSDLGKGTVSIGHGAPESALMAVVGMVAFAVSLMLLHVVTWGSVFSNPWVVPGLAGLVLVLGRRRLPRVRVERWGTVAVLAVVATAMIAIYVVPALRGGSSVRTGDAPWHLGWTEQLLAGEVIPSGPAPQEVARNAYPWGFHAVLATLVRLVPGSSPLVAMDAVFFLLTAALPLGAAVLARTFSPRAGWGGAVAMSFVGGFGWLAARGAAFATSPGAGESGADLVVASPNSVYELFPPPLPRELGLVLVAAAGYLVIRSARAGIRAWVLSGATVGLVGLVSLPMFVSAALWMTVGALLQGTRRRRALLASWIPAVVVLGSWAGPVLFRYLRFEGFVNITPRLGKEWALPVALGSWGLLVVAALVGAGIVARRHQEEARIGLGFGVATTLLLGLAIARGIFDWNLAGNATLLHQGRVWPPAHLLAAAFSGVALLGVFDWLRPRGRAVTAAVAIAVGSASPVLASIHLGDIMAAGEEGFIYGGEAISASGSFVQEAAARLDAEDVVSVTGSDELAFLLFQFSGCRLAGFDHPSLTGNDLRIRYRQLADAWDRRIEAEGYEPTHLVVPGDDPPPRGQELASGTFAGRSWALYPAP